MDGSRRPTSLKLPAFSAWKHSIGQQALGSGWTSVEESTDLRSAAEDRPTGLTNGPKRTSPPTQRSVRPSWTSTWSVISKNRRQSSTDTIHRFSLDAQLESPKGELSSPTRRRGSASADGRPKWTSNWNAVSNNRRQSADLVDGHAETSPKAELFSPSRRRGSTSVDDRSHWSSTWSVTSLNRRQSTDLAEGPSLSSRRMSDAPPKAELFSPTRRRGSANIEVNDRPHWSSTWSVTSLNRRQSTDLAEGQSLSSRRMSDVPPKAELFSPTRRRGSASVDDRPSWTSTWSITSKNRRQSTDLTDGPSLSSRRMSDVPPKMELFSPTRRRGSASVDAGDRPSWTSTWSAVSKNRRQSTDLTDGQEGFSPTRRRGSESTGLKERPSSENRRNSMEASNSLKPQRNSSTRLRGVVMDHGAGKDPATSSRGLEIHPSSTQTPDEAADKFDAQQTPRDRNHQEELRPEEPRDRQHPPDAGPAESQDSGKTATAEGAGQDNGIRTCRGVEPKNETECTTLSTELQDVWSQQYWLTLQTTKIKVDPQTDVNEEKHHQNRVVPQTELDEDWNHKDPVVPQIEPGDRMDPVSSKTELDDEKNLDMQNVQENELDEDGGQEISQTKPQEVRIHKNPTAEPDEAWSRETAASRQIELSEDRVKNDTILPPSAFDEGRSNKFSVIPQNQDFINNYPVVPDSKSQEILLNLQNEVGKGDKQDILVNTLSESGNEIPVVERSHELDQRQSPNSTFPQTEVDEDLKQEELQIALTEYGKEKSLDKSKSQASESDEENDLNQEELQIALTEYGEEKSLDKSKSQASESDEEKSYNIPAFNTETEPHERRIVLMTPTTELRYAWSPQTPAVQETELHKDKVRENRLLQQSELDEDWKHNSPAIPHEGLFKDYVNERSMVLESQSQQIPLIPQAEVEEDSNRETLVTPPPEHYEENGHEIPVVEDRSKETALDEDNTTFPLTDTDERAVSQTELDNITNPDDILTELNNGLQDDWMNEKLSEEEEGSHSNETTILRQTERDEDLMVKKSELLEDWSYESPDLAEDTNENQVIPQTKQSEDELQKIPVLTETKLYKVRNGDIPNIAVKEWKDKDRGKDPEITKVPQNKVDKDRAHGNQVLAIPQADVDQYRHNENQVIPKTELNKDEIPAVTELLWMNENPMVPQTELLKYRVNESPIDQDTELPENKVLRSEFDECRRNKIQISRQIKVDEDIVNENPVVLQTEQVDDELQKIPAVTQTKLYDVRNCDIPTVAQNETVDEWKDKDPEITKVPQNKVDEDRAHENPVLAIPETDVDQYRNNENPAIPKTELKEDEIPVVTKLLWKNENSVVSQTGLPKYGVNESPGDQKTELPDNKVQRSEFDEDWRNEIQISPQIKLDEDIMNENPVVLQTQVGEEPNEIHKDVNHETLTEPDKEDLELPTSQTLQMEEKLAITQIMVNCDRPHKNLIFGELGENSSHSNLIVEQDEVTLRIQTLETKLADMTTETEQLRVLSKNLISELQQLQDELSSTEQAMATINTELSETNDKYRKVTYELEDKSNILEATLGEMKLILTEGTRAEAEDPKEIVGRVRNAFSSLKKENSTLRTTVTELEDELSWEDRASVQASMEALHQNLRHTKHKLEVLQEEQARKNQIIECLREEQRMERESYDFKLQRLQEENSTLHDKLAEVKEKLYKIETENKRLKPEDDSCSVEGQNGVEIQTCTPEEEKVNVSRHKKETEILSTLEQLQREKEELSRRLEESREEADNLLRCQRDRYEATIEELLEDKQDEVSEAKEQLLQLEQQLAASERERENLQETIVKLGQLQESVGESHSTEREVKTESENSNYSKGSIILTEETRRLQTETGTNKHESTLNFTERQGMETIEEDEMKPELQRRKHKIMTKVGEVIETNGTVTRGEENDARKMYQETIYTVKGAKDGGENHHVTFLIPGTQTLAYNEQLKFIQQDGQPQQQTGIELIKEDEMKSVLRDRKQKIILEVPEGIETNRTVTRGEDDAAKMYQETINTVKGAKDGGEKHVTFLIPGTESAQTLAYTEQLNFIEQDEEPQQERRRDSETSELERQLALTRMTLAAMDRQFRELQESERKLRREREAGEQVVRKLLEKVELQQQSLEERGGSQEAFYREKAETLSAHVQRLQEELDHLRTDSSI